MLFIVSCLVVIESYLVMNNHVPILDTVLVGIEAVVYEFFPVLDKLQISQAPEIATSLVAGPFAFIFGLPLTSQIDRLCGPRLGDMEAQMKGRQRNPQKVRIK